MKPAEAQAIAIDPAQVCRLPEHTLERGTGWRAGELSVRLTVNAGFE